MSLTYKSQSALEYLMTYGWAILIIVIVAAVLYSFGIFNPSSSVSTTITGFSGLGSVTAQCMPNAGLLLQFGNSIGQEINVTSINVTSPIEVRVNPNALVPTQQSGEFFVPSSTLCASNSKYSISVSVTYFNVGSTFPGPYFSTGTVASQAGGNGAYVPITVTNSQTIPTLSPFQQMVNVSSATYTQYESSTLQNVFFSYQNGTVIPSWLESGNSNVAPFSIYWIKLVSGIAASSSAKLFMVFAPLSTNVFASGMSGEAPQLSPTYGEYDTGHKVFNFYDNFAGTTLNTGTWSAVGTNDTNGDSSGIIVNNGIELEAGDGGEPTWIAGSGSSDAIYQLNESLDAYGPATNGGIIGFTNSPQSPGISPSNGSSLFCSNSDNCYLGNFLNGANSLPLMGTFAVCCHFYILTTTLTSAYTETSINYTFGKTSDSVDHTKQINGMYIDIEDSGTRYPAYYKWVRTRFNPPNGVMPSVSFGSVS